MSAELEPKMTKHRDGEDALYAIAMGIKHVVDGHTTNLVDLRCDMHDVKAGIGSLTSRVSSLQRDMSEVKGHIAELRGGMTEVKGGMTEVKGGMAEILRRLPAND